jgi:glyoxylase I family protein
MGLNQLGFRRVDHASWTVAQIAPVLDFYSKVFGARTLYQMGPVDAGDIPLDEQGRDWTDAHLGVKNGRLSLAMLEFPDGFKVELFQYERPTSDTAAPLLPNHVGSHHLGIEVDDLDAATAFLLENGCRVMERIAMDDGPTAGSRYRYLFDPWNNIFELAEHGQNRQSSAGAQP